METRSAQVSLIATDFSRSAPDGETVTKWNVNEVKRTDLAL
jgi:hypothetical protein